MHGDPSLELPATSRRVPTKQGQEGVRYPDFLAVDEATLKHGSTPRVESISVKKRTFSRMNASEVERLVKADLQEATSKYGGTLEVRRPGHPLYGRSVQVSKVHIVYEAQGVGTWKPLIQELCKQRRVEVHFE
jgi:hypothetical protein